MAEENPILKYWQHELEIFKKNLGVLQEQINEDATHDLRVAVKKLRSCFKLYSGITNKQHDKKLITGLDVLFSIMGKSRDIHMSKQLLSLLAEKNTVVIEPILVYLQLLQDQTSEFGRQTILQFDTKDLDDLTIRMESTLGKLNDEQMVTRAKELIHSSIEKMEDDLKHFKERSHLIRKHLKDIFYQAKMFHAKGPFTKSQLSLLDTILDSLGQVHDHEVLISNLKNFRKTILSKEMKQYAAVKRIEGRVKRRKDQRLHRALEKTEHFKAGLQKSKVGEQLDQSLL